MREQRKGDVLQMFVNLSYEYEYLDLGESIILYNEVTSKTYIIDAENIEMIRDVIAGSTEEKMAEKYGELWKTFYDVLKQNFAVVVHDHPIHFFDTWDYGAKGISAKDKNVIPPIQARTLQLTEACDLQCGNCGGIYEFPCQTCEKSYKPNSNVLELNNLLKFINSLILGGLNELTIEGGDPFTDQERLMKIIDYVDEKSNSRVLVEIKTNGLRIKSDSSLLKKLKNRNVTLKIIVNEEYRIAQETILRILRNNNIKYSTLLLDTEVNTQEMCIHKVSQDEYCVSERLFLESDTLNRNTIYKHYHPCIVGKIYISAAGDISACRDLLKKGYNIGNITKDDLAAVISPLKTLWQNPQIEETSCLKCKKRKHCHSCPSLKSTMSGKIHCPFLV